MLNLVVSCHRSTYSGLLLWSSQHAELWVAEGKAPTLLECCVTLSDPLTWRHYQHFPCCDLTSVEGRILHQDVQPGRGCLSSEHPVISSMEAEAREKLMSFARGWIPPPLAFDVDNL